MNVSKIKTLAAMAWALGLATPALAVDGAQLATEKTCFNCHAIQGEKHGPAFRDVARRYAGQEAARAKLVEEIQHGTHIAGVMRHWSNERMPKGSDRVPVSEAEAAQLIDYILSLK